MGRVGLIATGRVRVRVENVNHGSGRVENFRTRRPLNHRRGRRVVHGEQTVDTNKRTNDRTNILTWQILRIKGDILRQILHKVHFKLKQIC